MRVLLGIIGIFALVLAFGPGCGGGGGGSDGGGGGGGNIARYVIEGTVNGVLIDPTNIQNGENVQFVVAGYTTSNQRIVQSATDWQLNDQSVGTISSGGLFTATNTGGPVTVSATAGNAVRTGTIYVKAAGQALVTGRLVDGYGRFPYGTKVDFYSGAALVGSSIAQANGTFRAIVPQTANFFEVNKGSIPPGYYKEYFYNGAWYLPQGLCMAKLPALSNGTTTPLGDILIPPTTAPNGANLPPPPPPDPCQ